MLSSQTETSATFHVVGDAPAGADGTALIALTTAEVVAAGVEAATASRV